MQVQCRYSTVQYSTVQYSTVQYSTVQCSAVQYRYSTVQYSTAQHSTVHCSIQCCTLHVLNEIFCVCLFSGENAGCQQKIHLFRKSSPVSSPGSSRRSSLGSESSESSESSVSSSVDEEPSKGEFIFQMASFELGMVDNQIELLRKKRKFLKDLMSIMSKPKSMKTEDA